MIFNTNILNLIFPPSVDCINKIKFHSIHSKQLSLKIQCQIYIFFFGTKPSELSFIGKHLGLLPHVREHLQLTFANL